MICSISLCHAIISLTQKKLTSRMFENNNWEIPNEIIPSLDQICTMGKKKKTLKNDRVIKTDFIVKVRRSQKLGFHSFFWQQEQSGTEKNIKLSSKGKNMLFFQQKKVGWVNGSIKLENFYYQTNKSWGKRNKVIAF